MNELHYDLPFITVHISLLNVCLNFFSFAKQIGTQYANETIFPFALLFLFCVDITCETCSSIAFLTYKIYACIFNCIKGGMLLGDSSYEGRLTTRFPVRISFWKWDKLALYETTVCDPRGSGRSFWHCWLTDNKTDFTLISCNI